MCMWMNRRWLVANKRMALQSGRDILRPCTGWVRRGGLHAVRVFIVLCAAVLAACSTALPTATTPTPLPGQNQPKQLATVFISPTPNEAERQATRLAASPTPDPNALTPVQPTPTVYVGVFLGESGVSAPVIGNRIGDAPPTPTTVFTRCAVEAATDVLGTAWRSDDLVARNLGCAIEGLLPFAGTAQTFEGGVMFVQPEGAMWAVAPGAPGQYWALAPAPAPLDEPRQIDTPPGLLAPAPVFLPMWAQTEGVRDTLGFAQFAATQTNLAFQRFEGGTLFYDGSAGQAFALLLDGTAYGPY